MVSCILRRLQRFHLSFRFASLFERCVAHTKSFVYGNYSYAELVCGELSVFRESYRASG